MPQNLYIVDDDQAVRASLHRLVARQTEYLVSSYASGDAFLERLRSLEPGVVLLDFHMAGTNGIAVLNAVRALSHRFVVVMLTAHGAIERSVDAMKAGAHDFIEKPYDPAALIVSTDDAFAELERRRAEATVGDEAADRLAQLSPRETDVLAGLATGQSNKQIAWTLQISPRTVEIYRANLMERLKARSLSDVLKLVFVAEQAAVRTMGGYAPMRGSGAG